MQTRTHGLRRRWSLLALAVGAIQAGCSAPRTAQSADLEPATGEVGVPRTYALNVHVIATSLLDITGDVDQTPIDGDSAALDGWGGEAATLGKRFTWLIGFEERTLEADVDFFEVYGGTKFNFDAPGPWAPYLISTIRYSQDLEFPTVPATASDDFFGWAAGGGVAYHATDRFFLDARVVYEGLFEDINARMGRDIGIAGVMVTIGAGFTF